MKKRKYKQLLASVIACSMVLSGMPATAYAAGNDTAQEVQSEDRRHLERADAPDHHVIQQADDVGYRVLNDDRHDDGDHLRVKRPIAKHSFAQLCAANFFCSHVYKTAFPRRKPMKAIPPFSGAAGCLLIVSKPQIC